MYSIYKYLMGCCIACLLHLTVVAQVSDSIPYAYSQVIPNLQVLKSGFPQVKDIDASSYYRYEADVDSGTYQFTGSLITTQTIREKLGIGMVKDQPTDVTSSAYRWWTTAPTIKKLYIYCDSFVLNESLWLPECQITIQARAINMQGFSIQTTPLPLQKSVRYTLVEKDNKNGVDGRNAGDINIICEKIDKIGKFIANGGDGEWVFVPEISVDWPKSTNYIEVYKKYACSDGESSGRSQGCGVVQCVAAIFDNTNYRLWPLSDQECWGYQHYDPGGIQLINTNDKKDRRIEDKKEQRRITYAACKPGKGGNGGQVNLTYSGNTNLISATRGTTGYFLPRINNDIVQYGNDPKKCSTINITSKTYTSYAFACVSQPGGEIECNYNEQYKLDVPSTTAINTLRTNLNLNQPNQNGTQGKVNNSQIPYIPHPEFYLMRIRYMREQYAIYGKKTIAQQQQLDRETNQMVTGLATIVESGKLTPEAKADYLTTYNKALELSQVSLKNLDEYNNPPGYRPMLSITSTLSYLENNLKTDLRLFVLADIMAREEQKTGAFLDKIPGMIDDLYNSSNKHAEALIVLNTQFNDLSIQARECEAQTEKIQKKLKALESTLREKAKTQKKYDDLYKAGIKTCALAASVIPYGQPVLGQVVGGTLNTIADNIGESAENTTASVMDKLDMSGSMNALAEHRLKKLMPKQEKDDPNFTISFLGAPEKSFKEIVEENKKIRLEKEEKELNAYTEKLNKKKELYTKVASGTKDILMSYYKSSVNKDEVEQRLAKLVNESVMFSEIQNELRLQLDQKAEIFEELNALVQKSLDLNSKIAQNSDNITSLSYLKLGGMKYSKDIALVMGDIRNSALDRLKWVEYQLVKVYEYTTLAQYELKMPCSAVLDEYYKRNVKDIQPKDIDGIVETLALAYNSQRAVMANQILQNTNTSHRQDAKSDPENKGKYGRKILIGRSDNLNMRSNAIINQLNEEYTTVIDLQQDFVDEIIKPDQSETRIIDLSLDKIEFDRVLPAGMSVDLIIDLEEDGVLRSKNDNFYHFQIENKEEASDRWQWSVRNVNGKNTITNSSELSNQYKALIKFMTSSESSGSRADNEHLFTLPPAWTKLRIKIKVNSQYTTDLPKVNQLMLSMRCDYVDILNKNNKVLDFKLDDAPVGTLYIAQIGSTTSTIYTNLYSTVKTNSEISLEVKEPLTTDGQPTQKFLRWDLYGSKVSKDLLTNKKITFKMTENTRIRAVFENANNTVGNQVLYATPSINGEVIARMVGPAAYIVLNESPTNGFQRVLYNGTQEAFVKQ